MRKETNSKQKKSKISKDTLNEIKKCTLKLHSCDCGTSGAIYGLGFIGALIYYISTATGFWVGVLGVLKALVWPAFLVLELFKYLKL
jgi:hypothetical protein